MQAFIATHPSGKEEWFVKRNGHRLFKTVIYSIDGKALPAYHAEKKKAKQKGFSITNIDSTTSQPKFPHVKAGIKTQRKTVNVSGRAVPLKGS